MRKRLTTGLAAGLLAAAMLPGVASAAPNPDSAAGRCGNNETENRGIGDTVQLVVNAAKAAADRADLSLGQWIDGFEATGMGIPADCANGDPQG